MILAGILSFVASILRYLVMFYIGKILSNSEQLRKFLSLDKASENDSEYSEVSFIVEKIGKLIMIIAVISAISQALTTIITVFKAII